jgi:L-asparagine transporter-like permease
MIINDPESDRVRLWFAMISVIAVLIFIAVGMYF